MNEQDKKDQIKVVVVDDHAGVRAGIKKLLINAEDILVIGEGEDGMEALELARTHIPDVMLLDVEMPALRGYEVARRIRDSDPDVRVLAVSSYNDRNHVMGMLESGAFGFITKEEAPELLVEAVRFVYEGKGNKWVSPRALKYSPLNQIENTLPTSQNTESE